MESHNFLSPVEVGKIKMLLTHNLHDNMIRFSRPVFNI